MPLRLGLFRGRCGVLPARGGRLGAAQPRGRLPPFKINVTSRTRRTLRRGLLDNLQLHQAVGPAVDTAPDVVGGNHEEVLDEGDTPRGKNDKD